MPLPSFGSFKGVYGRYKLGTSDAIVGGAKGRSKYPPIATNPMNSELPNDAGGVPKTSPLADMPRANTKMMNVRNESGPHVLSQRGLTSDGTAKAPRY